MRGTPLRAARRYARRADTRGASLRAALRAALRYARRADTRGTPLRAARRYALRFGFGFDA
eukprot:gene16698-58889_t